ncbi:FGGY family carbohydrate kinase, partial [Conexibacter sp. JD483]|uniref:FGGY family carbohydrate kinase n=2 Tax=Conexibacter TaxID=191494 RepID=UPI00287058B0
MIGIDVGSSSVKALVLAGDGSVVESVSTAHALVPTPGAVEADAQGWWEATLAALQQLRTPLREIAAVGLSGNMSSVVLLDGDGEPLRPAPLLADPRGAAELAALDPALRADLAARSRHPVTTMSSLAALLWLRDHDAATFARARVWVHAKDFIGLRLTGALVSDGSDAHNALVHDALSGDWDRELIARAGLDPALFPPLADGGAVRGMLTDAAARATGLPAGIPVAVGGGDMATAALGAGAVEPGTLALSLGTSVTAIAPLASPQAFHDDWIGKLTLHPLPGGRGAFALASLLTGGLALNWLRTLVGGTLALPDGDAVIPDPDDELVFVPQLSGAGSPAFAPHLRGALLGLTPHVRGERIALALFEAIAFELKTIAELVGPDAAARVVATGGGANIGAWVQTLADVLGAPVEILSSHDVSAVGAALLARDALGDPLPASAVGRVAGAVAPRPRHAAAWAA